MCTLCPLEKRFVKSGRKRGGLTVKQERFVAGYLKDGNASRAYRETFDASQMKETTVTRRAFDLLAKSNIEARVKAARARAEARTDVSLQRTLLETARVAFSDVRRLFDENGRFLALDQLDDDTAASVSSVEFANGELKKIKLWDKNTALDKLMRHLGAYKRDNEQKVGRPDRSLAAVLGTAARHLERNQADIGPASRRWSILERCAQRAGSRRGGEAFSISQADPLVFEQAVECGLTRELRVPDRVLNASVPEVVLDRAGIRSLVS